MKNKTIRQTIFFILTMIISVSVGWYAHFVYTHAHVEHKDNQNALLAEIFKYSQYTISEDNLRCDNFNGNTVGDALGSIFGFALDHQVQTVSAGCLDDTCRIFYNYCRPWQSSECGERMFSFERNADNSVNTESFSCTDIP